MRANFTPDEMAEVWTAVWASTPEEYRVKARRLMREMLRQAYVHGIIDGPNGNFNNYFEQKYGEKWKEFVREDDHIGI
jgi:hypothetical protein